MPLGKTMKYPSPSDPGVGPPRLYAPIPRPAFDHLEHLKEKVAKRALNFQRAWLAAGFPRFRTQGDVAAALEIAKLKLTGNVHRAAILFGEAVKACRRAEKKAGVVK